MTTVDRPLPTELKLSKEQLLQARKVNEKGTKAATLFQQNKQALNAWNSETLQRQYLVLMLTRMQLSAIVSRKIMLIGRNWTTSWMANRTALG